MAFTWFLTYLGAMALTSAILWAIDRLEGKR